LLIYILILLLSLFINHIGFFYDGDYRAYWFVANNILLVLLSYSKKPKSKLLLDTVNGYFLGLLIESFRVWILDLEMSHISEILMFSFFVIGFCWRKYKDNTITVAMITGLSTALKWVVTKILTILFS